MNPQEEIKLLIDDAASRIVSLDSNPLNSRSETSLFEASLSELEQTLASVRRNLRKHKSLVFALKSTITNP